MKAVLRIGRRVRWYVRQLTGEAKWDEYVADCARRDVVPMSRRDFERHRADLLEHDPMARCC
jgi:uncharacterized short protein YbdD (DUF466 family)